MGKPGPTAFVLSGGASLGAIQVGMLRALYQRGIAPDFIVGTSAGALNGAFIASRPQSVETADALADVWRGLRRGQVFPLNPLTSLLGFLGARDHLVPDAGLRRVLRAHLEREYLEQLPIPLHVVAVDVVTGEELRLSTGPVADAVMASASIPAVLAPVSWAGRMLMDGGVANNTPISHAVDLQARARCHGAKPGPDERLASRPTRCWATPRRRTARPARCVVASVSPARSRRPGAQTSTGPRSSAYRTRSEREESRFLHGM
jgi:predicted acylesterase/phospholipase RssA